MKIRKISLENLNSLVGEHVLDLGVEPIASAGIFAITGPTGAGKSTLLDAITLALYGRAARYGGPNPEDMMSRHHGSCRAEVEFEVDGVTYRAEWIRRRARGRADGRLQPATRFIYGADGEPLTQKLADADAMVERLSGLNYERFMRSVLLAQGDFARFLKSKEDERAELLESLTGTEVFSTLSARVYDEARSRERELEDEEVRLGAIIPLAPEARETKEQALGQLEGEQKAARTTLEAVIQNLSRAEELARAQEAEKVSLAALKRNHSEREVNRDGLERLGKHRKASEYFPLLERVDDSRKTLERLSVQAAEAIEQRDAARLNLDQGVVSAAALLEGWLRDRGGEVTKSMRECSNIRGLIGELEDWLQRHESDSSLTEELPAIFERIEALRGERKNWSTAQSKLRGLEKEKEAGVELRGVREK
ncbi:MAG: AAA family ATPase, partial [Verrucomicrobiales bacterium]